MPGSVRSNKILNVNLKAFQLVDCFIGKALAKNIECPKFQEMLNYVREGNMVVVHLMGAFAHFEREIILEPYY